MKMIQITGHSMGLLRKYLRWDLVPNKFENQAQSLQVSAGGSQGGGGGRQGVARASSALTVALAAALLGDQGTTWRQKETGQVHQHDLQTHVPYLKKLICKSLGSFMPS